MRSRITTMTGGLLAAVLVATVSGCSSANTVDTSSAPEQDTTAACGELPELGTSGDADLSTLPEDVRAGYAGYFADVNASAYTDFVSDKDRGFSIGYSDSFSANSWRSDALARLEEDIAHLKDEGVVGDFVAANSDLDNNLQIQQITSMIDRGVDAIIAIPGSPTAFDGVIKQAYDAGIPFITLASHVDSPYAINIDSNYFLTGVKVAAGLATLIDESGSVVVVDGINGSPASGALHDGYVAAFENCPDITVAGLVEGQWSEAVTKTAMLQYLATNPAAIDGFVNGGGESIGIIEALQQSGRDLAPIGDSNPDKGSLVQFRDNLPDAYVASTLPPVPMADAGILVAIGTLLGFAPTFDAIVGNPPLVTGPEVLDKWTDPSWDASDTNQAPAPPGTDFLAPDELSAFFSTPGDFPTLPER